MAKILIMEDDLDQGSLLTALLVNAGHQTELAYTGGEAWAILQHEPFDTVLTDIYVNTVSDTARSNGGLFLINKIRFWKRKDAPEWVHRLKIVAMTGAVGVPGDILQLATEFGADVCLRKPAALPDILEAVEPLPFDKSSIAKKSELLKFDPNS